jgi:hypothetical protein
MPPVPPRFAPHFIPGAELTEAQLATLERIGTTLDEWQRGRRPEGSTNPIAALAAFLADPALRDQLRPVPQSGISLMRGALERAAAALSGPLDRRFDYSWRLSQLIADWMRLLPQDDLPERLRTAQVRDHIDMRKVVSALLRRLDRIENGEPRQEQAAPPTIGTIPYTSPLSAPDLAQLLRVHGYSAATNNAVDQFLRRHRETCPDCYETRDRDDRRRNEPKYLYRPEVWPALVQHFSRATDET